MYGVRGRVFGTIGGVRSVKVLLKRLTKQCTVVPRTRQLYSNCLQELNERFYSGVNL